MTSLLHKGAWHYYSHGEYVKHKNGVPREVSKLHQVVRLTIKLKVLAVQWEEEKTSTIPLIDVPSLVHKVQYLNISFSPLELLFHAILMRFWLIVQKAVVINQLWNGFSEWRKLWSGESGWSGWSGCIFQVAVEAAFLCSFHPPGEK